MHRRCPPPLPARPDRREFRNASVRSDAASPLRAADEQDPQERAHAEQVLKVLSNSPDYAGQCQSILDNSSSPYAQHLAASSLLKMVTDQVRRFAPHSPPPPPRPLPRPSLPAPTGPYRPGPMGSRNSQGW